MARLGRSLGFFFRATFALVLSMFVLTEYGWAQEKAIEDEGAWVQGDSYTWYRGHRRMQIYLALDEAVLFRDRSVRLDDRSLESAIQARHPRAKVTRSNELLAYVDLPPQASRGQLERALSLREASIGVLGSSPVFYSTRRKDPSGQMVPTGEVIVHFQPEWEEERVHAWAEDRGLELVKRFPFASAHSYLFDAGDALGSLEMANEIYLSGEVLYAYPNWLRAMSKRALPDDTLFSGQWHLMNTGQGGGAVGEDLNIVTVWDTYRGSANEVIAIVDDGLEIGHEDLQGNVLAGFSWDWVGGDADPSPGSGDDHGTAVGGVAAADGFNTLGVTGAAPWAALVGYRLLGAGTDTNEAEALSRNNQTIDIYSSSWGPWDDGRLEGPGPLTEAAIAEGVAEGREGRGNIYVWSAGDGYDADNSNYDGYANSRYTIAVAASTNYGDHAWYSETGANILVNAPSSGGSLGITTTDRTGSAGFSTGNYTGDFGGTSSATPLVSGVIALILEANPYLSWRDVQQVLATTAEQNDPSDSDWTTNGAGFPVNHKYGFGRIDALAAVTAAESWAHVGPELSAEGTSSPDTPIPDDDATGVSDAINISEDISVEYVEIFFSAADHTYWGDLQVELTSPAGTTSILSEAHLVSTLDGYDNWRFGSVRHLGESSQGTWSLSVKDLAAADTGTFQSWTLRIWGEDTSAHIVNLVEMPWYENIADNFSTGAAVGQMILNYIREGAGEALLTQDEIYDYARAPLPSDGTELDADQMDKALGHFDPYDVLVSGPFDGYDSQPDGNPFQGYNYTVDTYDSGALTGYMRDICHWMDYEVTQEGWWSGPPLVARPNTPAAVPIFGDVEGYGRWVAVRGLEPHTNPWNTPDFTVYGFWMKDPLVTGIGRDTYKTAAESATYFKPLSTGDAYDGKFLQVAEPPAERSHAQITISRPVLDLENLAFIGASSVDASASAQNARTLGSSTRGALRPRSSGKADLKKSWRDLVDRYLLTDPEALAAFSDNHMGDPILVHRLDTGEDYYLVPFGRDPSHRRHRTDRQVRGRRTFYASAVVILDAQAGYFKEASWTERPERYLKIDERKALKLIRKHLAAKRESEQLRHIHESRPRLVWEPNGHSGSPYQPYWQVELRDNIWYVTQEGAVFRR
jgi:kexin